MKTDFQAGLQSKFENSDCPKDTSIETLSDQLKSAILQTSEGVLGFTTKNKNWFDENNQEIQELLAKKRSSHQAHLSRGEPPSISFAASSSTSFKRSKMSGGPKLQKELINAQTWVTTEATTKPSRVPYTGQMGKCFLQTRSPFWVVGLSTSNPSLALAVSFRTQQFSASPSNHSKQNWINYPLWKKLPKP